MAVDDRGRVHVVWATLVPGGRPGSEPTPALFYAMSRDARRFTPRQQIPTEGVPMHPQLALGARGLARGLAGGLIVTWDEQADGRRRIAVGRGAADDEGVVRFVREPIADAQRAAYPVLATTDEGIVLAWTSGAAGQTVLRTERLPY